MKTKRSRSRKASTYKLLKKQFAMPYIYPNPYQSMLLYYNQTVTLTDATVTTGFFAGAYKIQREVSHVNLRQYWGQYRVEKVTLTVVCAEAPTQTAIYLATTHSQDGATTAASTPTLTSIRSYSDCRVFQVSDRAHSITWYFNTNDPNETSYRDVSAVTITADDEFSVGGPQFFASQVVGAGNVSFQLLVKYKVRYMGKQSIAI